MIDESVLERLLRDEADTYVPPPGGPERVLATAAVGRPPRAGRGRFVALGAVAASVVAAVALAPLVTTGVESRPTAGSVRDELGYGNSADKQTGGGGAGAGQGSPTALVPGEQVVRKGNVSLEVPKGRVRDVLRDVARVAATHGGYVAESNASTSEESPSGYVTLRIPAAAYDRAVEDVGELGDVRHSETVAQDVSDQVTDVDARLRSATAARDRLRALLGRADDVGDVLAVQTRIDEVQTEIEKLTAAKQALADQTSLGTLSVSVSPPPGAGDRDGFRGAWHDAVNGFVGGFELLVAASGPIAFVLIVGVVLFFLARRAYRLWMRGVA